MSLRLYMDVHVKIEITTGLRSRGVDVLTAREDGADELPDSDLLDRATTLGRVLFSNNDLDEHIIAGVLRREPMIDFVRARDVGLDRTPDPDVLSYAADNGFVIVSHDVNTTPARASRRMAAGGSMAGLFLVRHRDPIAPVIDSLILIWFASEAEEWHDRIVFLPI